MEKYHITWEKMLFSRPFPESQGKSLWQVEVQELQEQSVKQR